MYNIRILPVNFAYIPWRKFNFLWEFAVLNTRKLTSQDNRIIPHFVNVLPFHWKQKFNFPNCTLPGQSNSIDSVSTLSIFKLSLLIQFHLNIMATGSAFSTILQIYTLTAINMNFTTWTSSLESGKSELNSHREEINVAKMQLKCQINCDELNLCSVRLRERAKEFFEIRCGGEA